MHKLRVPEVIGVEKVKVTSFPLKVHGIEQVGANGIPSPLRYCVGNWI